MSLDTCMLSKGSEGKEVESMIYIKSFANFEEMLFENVGR